MMKRGAWAVLILLMFIIPPSFVESKVLPYSGFQDRFSDGSAVRDVYLSPITPNASLTFTLSPYSVVRGMSLNITGFPLANWSRASNLTARVGDGPAAWRYPNIMGRTESFSDGTQSKTLPLNATFPRGLAYITMPRNATGPDFTIDITGNPQAQANATSRRYQATTTPGIVSDNVNAHWYDQPNDTLYAGTTNGLTILNLGNGSRTDLTTSGPGWQALAGNNVRDIFYDPVGRVLVVGTTTGATVLRYSNATSITLTTTSTPALPDNSVEGVWYDRASDQAFFATLGGGVAIVNLTNGARTVFDDNSVPSLPAKGAMSVLYSAPTKQLFIGMNNNGVVILDMSTVPPGKTVYSTATTPALVDNAVRQIDFDASSRMMYVATHGGVTIINLTSQAKRDLTATSTPALPGILLESLDHDAGSNRLFIATGASGVSGAGVAVVNLTSNQMLTYTTTSIPALIGNNARYVSYDAVRDRMLVSVTPTGGGTKGGISLVDFSSLPANISLDIGNDGTVEWNRTGPLFGTVHAFTLAMNSAAASYLPNGAPHWDAWSNEFVDLPVAVCVTAPGDVVLSKPAISFDAILPVNGLVPEVNRYISTLMPGSNITVPLNFTSDTWGRIRLSSLNVSFDVVPPVNHAPRIMSQPPATAQTGKPYVHQMVAEDIDNDTLVFSLVKGPPGMSLSATGLVSWTPSLNDTGKHSASVNVTDSVDTVWQNWTITVSSVAGNALPMIETYPVTAAVVGIEYSYDVNATDQDAGDTLNYSLDVSPSDMSISRSSGLIQWVPTTGDVGMHPVKVNVSDGKDFAVQSFSITVVQSGMNNLPQITSQPPTGATVGVSYTYQILAGDFDGDPLTYSLQLFPTGMTIDASGRVFWTPSMDQVGEACVVVRVSDGKGYSLQSYGILVHMLNHPPVITSSPVLTAKAGKDYNYIVRFTEVDSGDVIAVTLDNAPRGATINNTTLHWRPERADRGVNYFRLNVSDGRDFVIQEFYLNVTVPSSPPPSGPNLMPVIAVIAGVVAAEVALAAFLIMSRRKKAAAAAAAAAASRPEFSMEDIFMMYNDGRLMRHTTRRIKHEMDKHILTSMLTAIQNFVEVGLSREEKAPLGSMEYGKNKIMFERGKYCIMAVVISGGEPPELRPAMKETMANIETEFGAVLADWDGDAKKVEGVDRFMAQLSACRPEVPTPEALLGEAEVNVKMLSEVEFYQGFVRLKVAVKNDSDSVITDVTAKMVFNEEVLKLHKIEPAYQMMGREVVLGNVGRKEKKSLAYYLDPQTCTESYIDGALSFRDHRGELRHLSMKRKLVSVVCPILGTDENINVAMLKRLLKESLDKQDRKLFRIPDSIDAHKALSLARSAVQGHDMRLVREYVRDVPSAVADGKPQLEAEVWYYASVKGREDKLVIKITLQERDRTAEFFAASTSILVVTGMLAELKSDLDRELKEAGTAGAEQLPTPELEKEGTVRPDVLAGSRLESDPGDESKPAAS